MPESTVSCVLLQQVFQLYCLAVEIWGGCRVLDVDQEGRYPLLVPTLMSLTA